MREGDDPMSETHHLYSGDYGPCTELSAEVNSDHVQLTICEPSTDPQIRGRALATVRWSRFDADRFLTEILRSVAVFDAEPR
jgi:hypothetical protein